MTLPHLSRALLRYPAATAGDGLTTQTDEAPVDVPRMQSQYQAYCETLRTCGLDLTILPAQAAFPDGHYVEDVAVLYRDTAIIAQPAHPSRAGEPPLIATHLSHLTQVTLTGDATLEGGDVLFCADRVLIGLTQRTNQAGAEQLRAALHSIQPDLRVDLVPVSGVLHLKTGITELAPGVLLRHAAFGTPYDLSFARVIDLPEAESYAADVLPVNDYVLIPAGYPTVLAAAQDCYPDDRIITLEMSEFRKMDGGLTCLSLRY